ncbi:hypothetical protein F5Y14DRAFT_76491 [Nemania sp. NC0429]|nr:hypothetical protein F5Y14DRAFT_76491 [Nemania sp. NC0429]
MEPAGDAARYHIHEVSVQQPLSPRLSVPMIPPGLEGGRDRDRDKDSDLLDGTEDVATDLDQLVHRLNRKPIFQDSLRWRFLRTENGQEETEQTGGSEELRREALYHNHSLSMHMSEQWQALEPVPALGPIPELSMQFNPCPQTIPPWREAPRLPGPSQFVDMTADAPSENKAPPKTNDVKRPRRGTETRLHRSASNLRMLDLVSGMIENGVQCNVQNSTPPSPAKVLSTPLVLPACTQYIEPRDPIDPRSSPGRMQLEVDMGSTELDEDTLLRESLALRNASTPAGIRKLGFLRYRSSSEAAQACKNMKKSVPRMRRRHKTNSTAASEASVSRPPSAVS